MRTVLVFLFVRITCIVFIVIGAATYNCNPATSAEKGLMVYTEH